MFVPFLLLLLFLFLSSFVFFMFSFLFPLLPWTLSAVKLLFCANAAVSGRSPQRSCFCTNAAVSGRSTQKSCARICRIYNLSCIYLLLFSFWILQFQSYSAINDDPLHKYIDILYIAVFLVAHDMCVYSRHRSAHTTALLWKSSRWLATVSFVQLWILSEHKARFAVFRGFRRRCLPWFLALEAACRRNRTSSSSSISELPPAAAAAAAAMQRQEQQEQQAGQPPAAAAAA